MCKDLSAPRSPTQYKLQRMVKVEQRFQWLCDKPIPSSHCQRKLPVMSTQFHDLVYRIKYGNAKKLMDSLVSSQIQSTDTSQRSK